MVIQYQANCFFVIGIYTVFNTILLCLQIGMEKDPENMFIIYVSFSSHHILTFFLFCIQFQCKYGRDTEKERTERSEEEIQKSNNIIRYTQHNRCKTYLNIQERSYFNTESNVSWMTSKWGSGGWKQWGELTSKPRWRCWLQSWIRSSRGTEKTGRGTARDRDRCPQSPAEGDLVQIMPVCCGCRDNDSSTQGAAGRCSQPEESVCQGSRSDNSAA